MSLARPRRGRGPRSGNRRGSAPHLPALACRKAQVRDPRQRDRPAPAGPGRRRAVGPSRPPGLRLAYGSFERIWEIWEVWLGDAGPCEREGPRLGDPHRGVPAARRVTLDRPPLGRHGHGQDLRHAGRPPSLLAAGTRGHAARPADRASLARGSGRDAGPAGPRLPACGRRGPQPGSPGCPSSTTPSASGSEATAGGSSTSLRRGPRCRRRRPASRAAPVRGRRLHRVRPLAAGERARLPR